MINPAIETDLVGEIIEIRRGDTGWIGGTGWSLFARGLCRAVTAFGSEGGIWLWLEVRTELDRESYREDYGDQLPVLGDVIPVPVYLETATATQRIRLCRSGS